jgi:hypothetical protein
MSATSRPSVVFVQFDSGYSGYISHMSHEALRSLRFAQGLDSNGWLNMRVLAAMFTYLFSQSSQAE